MRYGSLCVGSSHSDFCGKEQRGEREGSWGATLEREAGQGRKEEEMMCSWINKSIFLIAPK